MHVTNCKFLNDQYENTFGLTILGKCLPKIEEELNVPSKDKLSLLLKNKAEWEKRMKNFIPNIGRDFYVFSTSKERDSLIMWSTYGNKGDGVAIGLDWDILKRYAENEEYQGFLENVHIGLKICWSICQIFHLLYIKGLRQNIEK